jgi:hypothetical protein
MVNYFRNGSTRIVNQLVSPPATTLDGLIGPVRQNLHDTVSRYSVEQTPSSSRSIGALFGRHVRNTSPSLLAAEHRAAILTLKAGGFDTRQLGLDSLD